MSDNTEELAQLQKCIGEKIEKMEINFRKDSEVRKNVVYLRKRIKNLQKLWEEFEEKHEQIENDPKSISHPYMVTCYYEEVEKIYTQLLEALDNKLTQKEQEVNAAEIKTNHERENENSELELQIKKQEAQKTALTRVIGKIQEEANIQHTKAYYMQKVRILTDYWTAIVNSYNNNMAINNSRLIQEEEFEELENEYEETAIYLQEKLDQSQEDTSRRTSDQGQEVNLPPVKIPTFNGDMRQWKPFHDLFTEMIDKNTKLKDVQKMQYLKSHIYGEAESVIRHLIITNDNYKTAWELLNNRFNNKRVIVAAHIQALITLQPLSIESSQGIKRIHDVMKENLHALENLGTDTKAWGPIIVEIIIHKLDKESHRLFEHSLNAPKEVPTLEELYAFLERRIQVLQAIGEEKGKRQSSASASNKYNSTQFKAHHTTIYKKCQICKGEHKIFNCNTFREMSKLQRYETCKKEKLCSNCLVPNHTAQECRSSQRCRKCKGKHNTMIHQFNFEKPETKRVVKKVDDSNEDTCQDKEIQAHFAGSNTNDYKVLLATAQINVISPKGQTIKIRALVDQGSEASFITEDIVQRLQLKKTKTHATIEGIGGTTADISQSSVQVLFRPNHSSDYRCTANALVLKKLTKLIPSEPINRQNWEHIEHLILADEDFDKPSPINMILGADIYSQIVLGTVIKGPTNTPIAQKTKLGYILSGPAERNNALRRNRVTCMVAEVNIDEQLKKFWELENIQTERTRTQEEKECEEIYDRTTKRTSTGRYIVKLPLNSDIVNLGNSRDMAVARLLQIEKKFKRDEVLEKEYKKFMKEYITLNHMTKVTSKSLCNQNQVCYLPHHAVIKETSTTTKVRVVFDASAKTSSGISLNDVMLNGPTLQEDIAAILLRWRIHKIAYTADIEKMYRQIEIDANDRKFQRILWRESTNQPIQEYQLNTVTYGTKAAPYLAIKTLHRLATDIEGNYPKIAKILKSEFYVDDLMSGEDSVEEALKTQQQLLRVLHTAGFNLRKWASNEPKVLTNLPREAIEQVARDVTFDETIKTLGIHWQPKTDLFEFKINLPTQNTAPTKRSLLSESSRLFDPLGWFAPTIVTAKIMFQELWQVGLSWDDKLPESMAKKWSKYKDELKILEEIKIPRWIHYTKKCKVIELHGFCDASEAAYAGVVYSRIITEDGEIIVTLLAAKTKVAPISNKISLPRLELCGAVLLSNLINQTQEAFKIRNAEVKAWTDSTIVLAWLKGNPTKWKTFVANRVTEIKNVTSSSQWNHVKSDENPADCASRGLFPSELRHNTLWWTGPKWLKNSVINYQSSDTSTDLEKRTITVHTTTVHQQEFMRELMNKYNNLSRLKRILAYCKRFVTNARNAMNKKHGPITVEELENILPIVIKTAQQEEFSKDIEQLSRGIPLNAKSKILPLTPIIDKDGLLRVGGRIQNAPVSYEQKHPIILPYSSMLTSMIINEAHQTTLHGGNTLTLSYIRNKYWIINGLRAVKKELHKCVKCHRYKAQTTTQLMGNLPTPRLSIDRPFTNTGVDYAGPLDIRMSKGRGNATYKGYIAIFVCLTTKAIHLEAVSDLTATAFIAALKRFIARRGNISNLYSDNGTNFIKANKILSQDAKNYLKGFNEEVTNMLSNKGIQWHFIPAASPHFGGLWEAGVKSIKYHLKRTIGESKLTFEELTTILTQIEACLNSRPICPITQDPDDYNVLTPGHFLIGTSLLAPPEKNRLEENSNTLTRWHLLERKHQEFWSKWSSEYLARLQQRPKWTKVEKNIQPGELVLLKEDNLPPSQWALGRIVETHPGKDGHTRVVSVKTAKNILKRPITKISSLPIIDNERTNCEDASKLENTKIISTNLSTVSTISRSNEVQEVKRKQQGELQKQLTNHINRLITSPKKESKAQDNTNIQPKHHQQNPEITKTAPAELIEKFRKVRDANIKPKRKIHPTTIPVRPPIEELVQENKKRRMNISPGSMIMTLLMILFIPPVFGQIPEEPITITPFKNHPGIYFEDISQAELLNNEWNIIVYYDLDIYWQELISFRNLIGDLKETCTRTKKSGQKICIKIVEQYQLKLHEMEFKNILLHSTNNARNKGYRTKRGAVNIVGNIANSLFGILDSEFAKQHEDQINQIKVNEDHILTLIKQQTSVAEATKNIIKKDRVKVEEQFKDVQNHIEILKNNTEETNNELSDHRQLIRLINLAIFLKLIMDNYMRTQDALVNVVTNIHTGKIDPLLLTPDQLQQQLNFIRNHLPSDLRVPADPASAEDTLQMYNLLSVKARVTSHNVILDVKIPLVKRKQFQLYKVIPVPTPHDKEFIYIEPTADYLIVSLDRDQYYSLNAEELRQCSAMSYEKILCKQHKPLYNSLSAVNSCEMNLFRHEKTLSPTCRIKSIEPSQIWIQLHNPNTWIYVFNREYTFNIICGSQVISQSLKGDGILKIRANCVIKQKTMTINAHNNFPSSLNTSFTPHINISELLASETIKQPVTLPGRIPMTKNHKDDIEALEQSIQELKKNIPRETKISSHDVHQYGLIYIVTTVILMFGVYSAWKRCRTRKLHLPRPAPRRLQPEDFVLHGSTVAENVQSCT